MKIFFTFSIMKKQHTIKLPLLILVIGLLQSFVSMGQQNFGPWKESTCYKGLEYCTRIDGYNQYAKKDKWIIKFRNKYEKEIHFNYVLKDTVADKKFVGRKHLKYGKEEEGWMLITPGIKMDISFEKVCLGDDDGKYASCDK
jgi:hypothetical protein